MWRRVLPGHVDIVLICDFHGPLRPVVHPAERPALLLPRPGGAVGRACPGIAGTLGWMSADMHGLRLVQRTPHNVLGYYGLQLLRPCVCRAQSMPCSMHCPWPALHLGESPSD